MREYLNITNECNLELMKRYPDNYFDLAIVDPPYGIGWDGEKSTMVKKHPKNYTKKTWDDTAPDKEYFDELIRVSKNQIIWGANHFISKIPYDSSCWIVWDKKKGDFSLAAGELAWTSFKTAVRIFEWQWHGFLQKGVKDDRIHPTQKPTALYQWLLKKYAEPNQKILDTHLGSGSIAIAIDALNKIEKMNLTLTACELDKEYFDNAIKKIEEETKWESLFA